MKASKKKYFWIGRRTKQKKEIANVVEVQKKINIGLTAYISFTAKRDKPKATDFKNILSALFIMTESKDVILHYKNKSQYMTRIDEIENWEEHFKKRMPSASTLQTETPLQVGDTSAATTSDTEIASQTEESSVP